MRATLGEIVRVALAAGMVGGAAYLTLEILGLGHRLGDTIALGEVLGLSGPAISLMVKAGRPKA